jgi:hypothetical protein
LPLEAVIVWVYSGEPEQLGLEGGYKFAVIVPAPDPLVTGCPGPEMVTWSFNVVLPAVPEVG